MWSVPLENIHTRKFCNVPLPECPGGQQAGSPPGAAPVSTTGGAGRACPHPGNDGPGTRSRNAHSFESLSVGVLHQLHADLNAAGRSHGLEWSITFERGEPVALA